MRTILSLITLIVLTGCGKPGINDAAIINNVVTNITCEVRDYCTHVDVPGYECTQKEWNPLTVEGQSVPKSFYGDSPCVITREDWQFESVCETHNDGKTCGVTPIFGTPIPCCPLVQGPGKAIDFN